MTTKAGKGITTPRDSFESTSDGSSMSSDRSTRASAVDLKSVSSIRIPTVKIDTVDQKAVALYQIVVQRKSYSYLVQRRFNDFVELHKQFNKRYQICFEDFPSKVTFYRSKESVLKERKAGLEAFLNYLRVVAIQKIESLIFPELYSFLEIGTCKK